MRKIVLSLFLIFVATNLMASVQVDGIYYYLIDEYAEVASMPYPDKYSGDIIIPSTITYQSSTYSVVSVGIQAFLNCTSLSSVTISDGISDIGMEAFKGCTSLTNVTLPKSLVDICYRTFDGCTSLVSISIPDSVKKISQNAFRDCNKLNSVAIGKSVISIEDHVFSSCTSLKSITIPNSVKSIKNNAFEYCSSLESISLGNGVNIIGAAVFEGCTLLASVTIPNSVESIGGGAFFRCTSLASVTLSNRVNSIMTQTFANCTSLKSITIPNSVTSIGDAAFENCTSLNNITCYASNPPSCGSYCFDKVNKSIPLYVPVGSIDAYEQANKWEDFINIQAISAEEQPTNTVAIMPTDNSVTITWPTDANAESYTIEIKKDGVVFCTLTFNAQGQLTSFAFAPGRGANNEATMAEAVASGYKFTITSLSPSTKYNYEIDTKNASGMSIANYTGTFTTTGTTTGLDQLTDSPSDQFTKIIKDGQLYILRDGKTYNAQGWEL